MRQKKFLKIMIFTNAVLAGSLYVVLVMDYFRSIQNTENNVPFLISLIVTIAASVFVFLLGMSWLPYVGKKLASEIHIHFIENAFAIMGPVAVSVIHVLLIMFYT